MTTLVNILTFSRIVLALIIFLFLMQDKFLLLAFICFILGGLSDYFDGYLARKHNAISQIGEIFDPIADKIFIVFIFFGISLNLSSFLLGFAGAIIISREIWVSALRDYNPRNKNTNATRVIFIAKIKTFVQMFTLSIYLFALAFNFMILIPIADIFAISSILITLYTGYLYTYSTFKN